MKGLLRLIVAIIWLLLRLVIFLITGHWLGKKPGEAQPQPVPGAPVQAPPLASQSALSPQERARLLAWLEASQGRVEALRSAARSVLGTRSLEAALDLALVPELLHARKKLLAGDGARAWLEHVALLEGALQAVAASVEARRDERSARRLADTESIAASLYAPLYEHLAAASVPLREPLVLALPQLDSTRAAQLLRHTRLWLVRGLDQQPERVALDARIHARQLADELPGFIDDLRSDYGLAPRLFVPPPQGSYDADLARGALGVWLPELAADVLCTFLLGPAYAHVLAASLARPKAPLETRVAYAEGRFLSARAPSIVRIYAVAHALSALGFHEQGERLYAEFRAAHPAPEVLLLPRADGSAFAVPSDYVLAELDPVLESLTSEPHAALAEHTLLDVPGFSYQHGEHAQALSTAQALAGGQAVAEPPRIVAAGALLALAREPARRREVIDALGRSVRGAGTLEALAQPERRAERARAAVPSIREMARDRGEIAHALALGAAFERPHSLR